MLKLLSRKLSLVSADLGMHRDTQVPESSVVMAAWILGLGGTEEKRG